MLGVMGGQLIVKWVMKNKVQILTGIVFSLLFSSCREKDVVPIVELHPQKSIEVLSDSSLFSKVRRMKAYQGDIFITEVGRGQILRLDADLNLKNTIGGKGNGPTEMVEMEGLDISGDTIAVFDVGNARIQFYDLSGKHLGAMPFRDLPIGNKWDLSFCAGEIVCNNSRIALDSAFVRMSVKDTSDKAFFGRLDRFDSEMQTYIRNGHFFFEDGEWLWAVSDNLPFLDRYDRFGNHVERYDFSQLPVIKDAIAYVQIQQKKTNSYATLINGACFDSERKRMYLLCNSWIEGEFFRNRILVLDLSSGKIQPECVWKLPDDVYRTMCLVGNKLYVFNGSRCLIERFGV